MIRRFLPFACIVLLLSTVALAASLGCQGGGPPFGDPLYINPGEDPYDEPGRYIAGIYVGPPGVNLAVGGLQQFEATATFNDATTEYITDAAEWYTETQAIGQFEAMGGKFLAKRVGVAIVRCRIMQAGNWVVSTAAYVNAYNPNKDLPPAVVRDPSLLLTDEGVKVFWAPNVTDGDLAGYNIYRYQTSTSHYTPEYSPLNDYPVLYPPYLDKTVVSGWYFYRVTAEDLLGIQSAPSEEVGVFVTDQTQ